MTGRDGQGHRRDIQTGTGTGRDGYKERKGQGNRDKGDRDRNRDRKTMAPKGTGMETGTKGHVL